MSKKQFKSSKKKMTKMTNSLNKCFCGQPFDDDGVCANGHIQDEEYFFSEDEIRGETTKKDIPTPKPRVCKPFGCRCNICGASIPEGDDVCDNGHMIGEEYPDN